MIPESIDPEAPPSERYVFNRLRATLPESWTVIHGRRFLIPGEQEGELDFLILDPRRGMLGVEVKGGGVERRRDGWVSTDRSGQANRIQDPGRQASRSTHAIHRFLSGHPRFGRAGKRCRISWGVLLPDVDVRGSLGPDLPRGIVIDRNDFTDPRRAVDRLFEAQKIEGPELSRGDESVLLDALLPTYRLIPSLAARLNQDREALIRLTDEQITTLDMLEAIPRVAIEGTAGTGKTLLALEKARRLAELDQRVLLLCFNRPLADELARSSTRFEVDTFHGICRKMSSRAELEFQVPQGRRQQEFWADEAPLILMQAMERLAGERYDAVIVDEGQDFLQNWWPAVEELLKEPRTGILYVFFDPLQNLYGGGPPEALQVAPTRLVYNCRNTSKIANYSARAVGLEPRVRVGAPAGAEVEELECRDGEDAALAVRRTLHRLVNEERVSEDQIVVLSTRTPQKSCLAGHRRMGNFQLIPPDAERGPGGIVFTSLQRFKGLEADVILLVDVHEGERTSGEKHLYVGSSRARHLLVVVKLTSD